MDTLALGNQIYSAALPALRGRVVTDLVVGLSLLGVELDHRDIALAYVLREDLGGGCSIFPYAAGAVGMKAEEVGRWFFEGGDNVQRAIGCAVLTAAESAFPMEDSGDSSRAFGIDLRPGDTIGMVGNIRPVAMRLRFSGCPMMIFDRGKCEKGNPGENIYPMERQDELLPKCSVVFISGTAAVNSTAAHLFDLCSGAREMVMVGSSVPMVPDGFRDTPVTVLAGSFWRHEDKEVLFRLISRAAGMQALGRYMIKKSVRIRRQA